MKKKLHDAPLVDDEKKIRFQKDSSKYIGSASSYKRSRPVRKVVKRRFENA